MIIKIEKKDHKVRDDVTGCSSSPFFLLKDDKGTIEASLRVPPAPIMVATQIHPDT